MDVRHVCCLGMSRPSGLFLVILDASVSLLSELVWTTRLMMMGCFRTTHLWGWTMNGLQLGRFIKEVFNDLGCGCTSVLSFRVTEASLKLEATFWRQFSPRVSASVGGSWNNVTLRQFLRFWMFKVDFLFTCLLSHSLVFLISLFPSSAVFSSSGDTLLSR